MAKSKKGWSIDHPFSVLLLQQEGEHLRNLGVVQDVDVVHTTEANVAIATAITHIVTHKQHLLLGVAEQLCILQCSIVLVVLLCCDVE